MQTIPTRGAAMPPPMPPRAPAGNGYAPAQAPVREGTPPVCVVELADPVAWHNEVVDRIELRRPTYGDYMDCGPILRHITSDDPDQPGKRRSEMVEDQAAMTKWMARLSGRGENFLRLLSWRDGKAIAGETVMIVADLAGNSERDRTAAP